MEGVPGGGGGGDRRGVVDSGAGKQPESLVAHAQKPAEGGEEQGRQNIKQENHRDGLGDFLVVGADDRGRGRNGRPAADGGAYAYQNGNVVGHGKALAQDKGNQQGDGDGGADNGQGQQPHLCDFRQVQAKAQQDDRILQDFFRGEGDAGLQTFPASQNQGGNHPRQNGEYRAADDREQVSQKPAGHRQQQADQQAGKCFFDTFHFHSPFSE